MADITSRGVSKVALAVVIVVVVVVAVAGGLLAFQTAQPGTAPPATVTPTPTPTPTPTATPTPTSTPPRIVLKSAPTSAAAGEVLSFTWEVAGSGSIVHTAVHWDMKPGNPTNFQSYSQLTPDFAKIDPADQAPATYTVSFNAPTEGGTLYYVVHAVVDGQHLYLEGGERAITITAPATPTPTVVAVTLTVQDQGSDWAFTSTYEVNPTIRVKQGDTVQVTLKNNGVVPHNFVIDELNVELPEGASGGQGLIDPGDEATATFTADAKGTFAYYCAVPGHRQLGMEGQIIVE